MSEQSKYFPEATKHVTVTSAVEQPHQSAEGGDMERGNDRMFLTMSPKEIIESDRASSQLKVAVKTLELLLDENGGAVSPKQFYLEITQNSGCDIGLAQDLLSEARGLLDYPMTANIEIVRRAA